MEKSLDLPRGMQWDRLVFTFDCLCSASRLHWTILSVRLFFVISAGGVEVLASSSSGGYFVLLGAPFDGVYLEVGGWLAKRGGGCFVRGTLLQIWARVLNLGDLV